MSVELNELKLSFNYEWRLTIVLKIHFFQSKTIMYSKVKHILLDIFFITYSTEYTGKSEHFTFERFIIRCLFLNCYGFPNEWNMLVVIKMHAFAEIWPFGWFMLRGTKQENAVLAKCHPLGFGTVISRILTLIFSPFLDNISWIVRDVPWVINFIWTD